jgi:holdfast attachment protein HfaA
MGCDTLGQTFMPIRYRLIVLATAAMTGAALIGEAGAGDYKTAASYNNPYGMSAGQENQAINPSLRDANGNLTVVNGQFTSSSFSQQTGVQSMGTISSGALSSLGTSQSGVGTTYGTATAIGNSLNVVTVGNNNTVIVNSSQINNGNQTATTSINGSTGK